MADNFNVKRLVLARKRRRLTGKALAEKACLSAVTLSRLENGENRPDQATVKKIADALGYPQSFFFQNDPEEIDTSSISFRSLSKMSAKEHDAAKTAGELGLELSNWLEYRFRLPPPDLLDLSYETDPDIAARALRQHWGLGEKPVANMLRLLEAKGVRVFSLSENTATVDAFSFWRDDKPYIFLNNFKSAEHSIFDSAHELGHLVLHRHGGSEGSRSAEREANQFASAFLMPKADVRSRMHGLLGVAGIISGKARWRVSAMALAYRLHAIGLLSEWQYKSACIELGRRGYRSGEPNGLERETSAIWQKVLAQLWSEKTTKSDIANDLNLPLDEIEGLIWGVTGRAEKPEMSTSRLRLVQ